MSHNFYCILVVFATLFAIVFLQFIAAIFSACFIKFIEKSTESFWSIAIDEFIHMIIDCPTDV